jgi:hypothetical protein
MAKERNVVTVTIGDKLEKEVTRAFNENSAPVLDK